MNNKKYVMNELETIKVLGRELVSKTEMILDSANEYLNEDERVCLQDVASRDNAVYNLDYKISTMLSRLANETDEDDDSNV